MGHATIRDLLSFLARLKGAHIYYGLADPTEGAIMVEVSVPGERWEIEYHEDGKIGVEVFVSNGSVGGAELLEDLIQRFSDQPG
jgi:hypothetical protein